MWIMTKNGFVSAVQKHGKFQLRARDRESLLALGYEPTDIVTGVGTDYPFRVYTTREIFTAVLAQQVREIDYTNFKDAAKKSRGAQYADALNSVWFAMLRLEPKDALSNLGKGSWRLPTRKGKRSRSRRYDEDWYRQDALADVPEPTDRDLRDLPLHMLTDEEWAELERTGQI